MTAQTVPTAPAPAEPIAPAEIERLLAEHAPTDAARLCALVDELSVFAQSLVETGAKAKLHRAQRVPPVYAQCATSIDVLSKHLQYHLRLHRLAPKSGELR